ncbi:MAG: transglutaminase-like domain-containing protein, partial [Actinomycetota bacterium]
WMRNEIELEYYATPGPMTDLSGCPPGAFQGLPDAPADLMRVVRGCVVASIPAPEGRDEAQIRPAPAMVERILELQPSPLVEPRPPVTCFLGNCRHFATLSCALLRRKRIPARVRAGFAGYFQPDIWVDHWIIEYWRPAEERWVRADPQYDDDWFRSLYPNASSESVVERMYLSGGEAWQRCRRGELDPNRCNMGGENWGIGEVRGSVMYDFAALNQAEMLPWDVWGQMEAAYRNETDDTYDELLDSISAVTGGDDFGAIRELYDGNGDLRVPASLLPA